MYKYRCMQVEKFLKIEHILEIFPVCKSTWYNGVKANKYPKPLETGTKYSLWKEKDIKDFINSLKYREPKSKKNPSPGMEKQKKD
jgi:predicted DNA-binding transcriptional regulator AlpA